MSNENDSAVKIFIGIFFVLVLIAASIRNCFRKKFYFTPREVLSAHSGRTMTTQYVGVTNSEVSTIHHLTNPLIVNTSEQSQTKLQIVSPDMPPSYSECDKKI